MSFCPSCGGGLPAEAKFCPACGQPVDRPPVSPAVPLPPWVRSDWSLAAVCAFAFLVALFAAGGFHGAVLGVTALGVDGLGLGLIAGAYIPFAALGGDTTVAVAHGEDGLFLAGSALMVAWLAVPAVIGARAVRFGQARTAGAAAAWAFVAKLALLSGVGFGVAGGLGGTSDPPLDFTGEGFRVAADVGAGEAAFWLVVGLGILGARMLRRQGIALLAGVPGDIGRRVSRWSRSWGRMVLRGAGAWAVLAGSLGVAVSAGAVVAADGTTERLLALEAAPALVANAGVAGAAVASGASLDTTAALVDLPFDVREADRSLSLFHFDLPPDDDSGPAPLYLFPTLLLAPAVVAVATWRALSASHPPGEQEAFRVAFAMSAGFVLTAWVAAGLAPLVVSGGAVDSGTDIVRSAAARPSVGATAGLALVWGLAASLATALAWVNRRPAGGPPPPTTEPGVEPG